MRQTSHCLYPEFSVVKMFKVLLFILCVGGGECGSVERAIDVCYCPEYDGSLLCNLQHGGRLKTTGCGGKVRTSGAGFVTGIEPGAWDKFDMVVLERATLSCADFDEQTVRVLIVDGQMCKNGTTRTTTTTSTQTPVMTKVKQYFQHI